MPDLSQFGTVASAPPPQGPPPASGGGGLAQFGTPDLSQFGTPADAAKPSSSWIDEENSAPGDVHFKNPVLDSASQFLQGIGSSLLEVPATIGGVAHRYGGNIIGNSDPITDALKKAADMNRDTLSAKGGALFENMAEWVIGEGALKSLTQSERMLKLAPVVKMLEKFPKLTEAVVAHPEIASALRNATLGTAQAAAHGADTAGSLESGATAAVLGAAGEAAFSGGSKLLRSLQEKVAPTTLDIGGVPVTQLASEVRGPNGELLAPEIAQKAARYGSEPALRAERQGAFKQLQSNLAKTGIENHLNELNDVAATAGPGQATTVPRAAAGWRYIPPTDSSGPIKFNRPLTPDETRKAMGDLKELWLNGDWNPEQESKIQAQFNDMKEQLKRHDALNSGPLPQRVTAGMPTGEMGRAAFTPGDIEHLVGNTDNYGDAASHLRQLTDRQLHSIPEDVRTQYAALNTERSGLQDAFDRARNDPAARNTIMEKMDDLNTRLEDLFQKGAVDSPELMAQPLKTVKLANAFDRLQKVMDQHFNLRADTAERIGEPQLATKLKSLSDQVEGVRAKYGDVLDQAIGPSGLDHIIKLGTMLDQPKLAPAAKGYLQNLSSVLKHYFGGRRGAFTAGGAGLLLAHASATGLFGGAGGFGVLSGEALYRQMMNKMATDPAFAETMMQNIKNNVPLKRAAKGAASLLFTQPMRESLGQGFTNKGTDDADSE